MFPNANLDNLVAPSSDHYRILLNREPSIRPCRARKNFKFENAWRLKPSLKEVVQNCWQQQSESDLVTRLGGCAEELKHWSKTHCNQLRLDIEECRRNLARFRGSDDAELFESLQRKMTQLLVQEDVYWKQRAKSHWYKEGNLNNKFFHASATARKKVNKILFLEDEAGVRVTDDNGMASVAKGYFDELFRAK
ncbi:hypothetical protein MtrunA17_Chr7g0228731 [Medicago truncatula]|uniref:Endonuclease/exonuclease/phosphatase family protein n=1 Tax=Medicago truncatula TaxID=3880 RepID=A0A396GW67_MEDTR|nr:hypothetical protein MtrunA17_Chr7g0228731 [Medicago truncatula]